MAGKTTRTKAKTAKASAASGKPVVAREEANVAESSTPGEPIATQAIDSNEAVPCTQSHIPNARTRKALRDADDGKNLTRHVDEDDLFRKLGITLGEERAQGR